MIVRGRRGSIPRRRAGGHAQRLRQPKHVDAVKEHLEYAGAADDGDGAGMNARMRASVFERCAGRIPQRGFVVFGIGAYAQRCCG